MKVLITGGCGFIGANIAKRHLEKGDEVVIIDNLSRSGADKNLHRIYELGGKFSFYERNITKPKIIRVVVNINPDIIYHMAAQVSVTASISDPLNDFADNAIGTLLMLESARASNKKPFFIYASTNKVYGDMADIPLLDSVSRYNYKGIKGISEERAIDFHSPYGCSKGGADQYVRDYSRVYGVDTVVFRQSCIYGEMQVGIEDQGWLSWFCQQFKNKNPIKIYGDGKQVRDVLYIDDLLDLYDLAYENREKAKGQIYNAGGGEENTLSLLELITELETLFGYSVDLKYCSSRQGDQKVYISDITKAKSLGWNPVVNPKEGIRRLCEWTTKNL